MTWEKVLGVFSRISHTPTISPPHNGTFLLGQVVCAPTTGDQNAGQEARKSCYSDSSEERICLEKCQLPGQCTNRESNYCTQNGLS